MLSVRTNCFNIAPELNANGCLILVKFFFKKSLQEENKVIHLHTVRKNGIFILDYLV